ncbi:hypothetical protein [Algibacter sp. R77976]|uniref:hypothetical protein n=1 Tax=Algibacter sp. R77976 TaxID=3093873 RepID=UPI0037C5B3BB
MKKLILALLICTAFSCDQEETSEYNSSLEEWNTLKKQNNDSYTYTTSTSSWVGYGTNTTLIIQKGTVISRAYEAFQFDESNGSKIITDSYLETSKDLNTHENGFATLTMDELYNSCIENYLSVNKNHNTIYFETNNFGILSNCGFVPDNCADDCFRGFRISLFEWL